MRRHFIVILFCPFLIFSMVCCDSYFEPEYTGKITEDDYYDNMNNLRFGLNAVYNVLQSKDYQVSELLFGEAVSDNMWTSQDVTTGAVYDIVNFTFSTDNSYILRRYEVNYQGINKANQVIRSIERVRTKDIGSTQKEIREVYGQAKVLRALFYFNLVRTYGGVSIQPEKPTLDSLFVPRSTEAQTYEYIEKDLRESLLLLRRSRYTLDECGQIDIGGALGLLMKVLLYEASPGIRTPQDIKSLKLEQAAQIGRFFIEGTQNLSIRQLLCYDADTYGETWEQLRQRLLIDPLYSLESEFSAADVVNQHRLIEFDRLFRVTGEFSEESLIEINHYNFSGAGASADEGWKLYDNMLNGGSPVFATCTKAVGNLLQKDPRKVFSITEAQNKDDYISQEEIPDLTKGVGDKLLYSKYYVFPSEGSHSDRNYRVLRYAEAILIYAEVLNELGETAQAVDYVNQIRARARRLITESSNSRFVTNATAAGFTDVSVGPQDVVREAVLQEKRVELCGEWDRWYEVCRLDRCQECMEAQLRSLPVESSGKVRQRGKYFKKGINERFPIPQKEVFLSNGVIEQNHGY